jgi:aconitate hydratase
VNFGIVPLEFADESDYDAFSQEEAISFPDIRVRIEQGDNEIPVTVGERTITTYLTVSPRQRDMLLAGGTLNLVKQERA